MVSLAVLALLVAAVGGFALLRAGDSGSGGADGGVTGPKQSGKTKGPPSDLVVLAVRGDGIAQPFLTVIGTGERPPAAISVPGSMTMVMPGFGDGQAHEAADLPGPAMATAVSNLLGMWTEHYAVTDAQHLAAYADRLGGLRVNLLAEVSLGGTTFGPGNATLDGAQLTEFLDAPGVEGPRHWRTVLDGLLAVPFAPKKTELLETDDLQAVTEILSKAGGVATSSLPAERVPGGVPAPDWEKVAAAVARLFGGSPSVPVPVSVLNGSGVPGAGEQVAVLLVPSGFRVVSSENAESFDHKVTEVVALGEDHRKEADRLLHVVGVGRVSVSAQSSGLADVAIVVGKDLTNG
jgi:hypothetical protein